MPLGMGPRVYSRSRPLLEVNEMYFRGWLFYEKIDIAFVKNTGKRSLVWRGKTAQK